VIAWTETGWIVGYTIGIVVVLVVVALVVPILLLARRIGGQAQAIDDSLQQSVTNTAGLADLRTTIDSAEVIVAGLHRGRTRLGG
jgi:hypothetical protein